MKRAIFLLAASLLTGFAGGCHHNLCDDNCNNCGSSDQCGCGRGGAGRHYSGPNTEEYTDSGPPSAAVTYPYYTTRGPRDFLAKNPRGIGP